MTSSTSLEFSEPILGRFFRFSPNGHFFTVVRVATVFVHSSRDLDVYREFDLPDRIHCVEWGRDSEHLLVGCFRECVVYVYNIHDEDYEATVSNGIAGIIGARLDPPCHSVLLWSQFCLRVTIFSLIGPPPSVVRERRTRLREQRSRMRSRRGQKMPIEDVVPFDGPFNVIESPKFPNCVFSPSGRYGLLVTRRDDLKDRLGIYVTDTWQLIREVELPTSDLSSLRYSPCGKWFACCDDLLNFRLSIHRGDGQLLSPPYEGLGQSTTTAAALSSPPSLGVRCYAFSPLSRLVAIGTNEGTIHLISDKAWDVCCGLLEHDPRPFAAPKFIEEENHVFRITQPRGMTGNSSAVKSITWSETGEYLISQLESNLRLLWVWELSTFSLLSLIELRDPVTSLQWIGPSKCCYCCGNSKLYFWEIENRSKLNSSCLEIPTPMFRGIGLVVKGNQLVCMNRNQSIICYLESEEVEEEDDEMIDELMDDDEMEMFLGSVLGGEDGGMSSGGNGN